MASAVPDAGGLIEQRSVQTAKRECSILIDARGLNTSGIGRYLREILAGILADTRFGPVVLLGDPEALRVFCAQHGADPRRVIVQPYAGGFYSPASQIAWTRLRTSRHRRADVTFFPHYDVPLLFFPERSVVTVHDLTHFKVPEAFAAWRRAVASVVLRRAVSGAARVITVSKAACGDLAERFPWAETKLRVVSNGVSSFFQVPVDPDAITRRIGISPPYLLCVGNRKPHKNLVAAVETLALLHRDRPDLRLVIVGEAYRDSAEVTRRAAALGVRDSVVEIPVVGDEELRGLYASCEALLFPSLYEGFGLPIVEAMACGAPVIASNRASLPEVVGDAGLLVGPHDYPAMAEAVVRLSRQSGLRKELVRRGHNRATTFSWEKAARRTVEVLYGVGKQRSPATRELS